MVRNIVHVANWYTIRYQNIKNYNLLLISSERCKPYLSKYSDIYSEYNLQKCMHNTTFFILCKVLPQNSLWFLTTNIYSFLCYSSVRKSNICRIVPWIKYKPLFKQYSYQKLRITIQTFKRNLTSFSLKRNM